MSKREEAVKAIARAIYCESFMRCCFGEQPDANDESWMSYEGEATAAYDAAIKVLMEPDEAMLMAGRKQTFTDVTGSHLGPNAERTFKAMLKAASA